MSRGWRNFCEENGQEPGGFFMFKLVGNRETPVLSLGLTESNNDTRVCSQASERESLSTELSSEDEYIQGESSEDDCSSMESLMETGKKKCSPKRRVTSYASYSSYLPYYKRYVTFTLRHGYATHSGRARNFLYRGRKKIKKNNLTTKNYIYSRHTPLSIECKNLFKPKIVCIMTVSFFRVFCIFKVFKKKHSNNE